MTRRIAEEPLAEQRELRYGIRIQTRLKFMTEDDSPEKKAKLAKLRILSIVLVAVGAVCFFFGIYAAGFGIGFPGLGLLIGCTFFPDRMVK